MPCDKFMLTILNRIERQRQLLNKIACDKSLTDPEVLTISQNIDCLLNEYERLIRMKN